MVITVKRKLFPATSNGQDRMDSFISSLGTRFIDYFYNPDYSKIIVRYYG